jgi:hypothetical protein
MLRRSLLLGLSVLVATSVAISPASAQRGRDRDQAFPGSSWNERGDSDRQREVPLNAILRELRMRYGGQHLDAQRRGDRWMISWITEQGQRLTIEADVSTGRIISTR